MASKAVKELLPEDREAIKSFLDNETSLADLVAQGKDHFVKTQGSKVMNSLQGIHKLPRCFGRRKPQ